MTNKLLAYLERSFWAALWVVVAPLTANQLLDDMHIPEKYWFAAPILIAVVAALKNFVAQHTGNKASLDFSNASVVKPDLPKAVLVEPDPSKA